MQQIYASVAFYTEGPNTKVFATEFFTTFLLVYNGFTVAFEDAERQKKESSGKRFK